MSRKTHKTTARQIMSDARYNSKTVAKFINHIMEDGKKSIATRIMYDALEIIQTKTETSGLEILTSAINKISPTVEVKSKRVGGATYQVPVEVKSLRKDFLAMKWILDAAHKRTGRSMSEKLAAEIQEAHMGRGGAAKKREEVHKIAESNKSFAQFRF